MTKLKFIYSEKATKFCKISTLLLYYVVHVKSKVEISQNIVAFSECMNYTNGIKEYDILSAIMFNFRFTLTHLHHLLFWSEKNNLRNRNSDQVLILKEQLTSVDIQNSGTLFFLFPRQEAKIWLKKCQSFCFKVTF